MSTITITGYEQDGNCEHCGRALKHCIRISDGRIVGAACFDKKLTAPKIASGKSFRVGAENIVRYAKMAQFWNPAKMALNGVQPHHLQFELA